ncbi:hypothetical protein [Flavobacterium subsaxonicum]|uniref:Glycosyltransferase 2-like domain-containing protein n=1 Tax=Flavobacterium subsaxonicum WB 4.1-42 = DSM 21790 TaxID=1121898 RepID=A0A0A2MEU5_9FLAO|nr:hypothetical protein [Flavobacterium subsaxonicum]KGO91167.1 hypothetical protein Q766_19585 [Flavobacterium subsaxonicum WB 4.1-42 = DSM 21790]
MNATLANPKINIVFRSCDLVNAVHNAPRPYNLDKKTLIKVCFKSLHNALQGFNHHIVVLGDNLSAEMKAFFLTFNVELIEGIFGNDNSIRECVKIAQRFNDDEWVYFCEDDYLHTPDAIAKIVTLIKEANTIEPASIKLKQLLRKRTLTLLSIPRFFKKPGIVISPTDYPDRYVEQYRVPNFIWQTSNSHWRQISDTTFTFLMQAADIKKKKRILLNSANRANDRYLSNNLYGKSFFFNKLLCLSPMPSLSTHMHVQTMSALQNWDDLVAQLTKEIA